MQGHRPDVLFLPDAEVEAGSQLLDSFFQLPHSGHWCGPARMRCAERPVPGLKLLASVHQRGRAFPVKAATRARIAYDRDQPKPASTALVSPNRLRLSCA